MLTATMTVKATPGVSPALLRFGVRLNEIMTAPGTVDWNDDGLNDEGDVWIELANTARKSLEIGGWSLVLGTQDDESYEFPPGTSLASDAYLILYQSQSSIDLAIEGGTLRLVDAEGEVVDTVVYPALPADISYSRDRVGRWHDDWPASPGAPNLLLVLQLPDPTPSVSGLRLAPSRSMLFRWPDREGRLR